MKLLATFWCFLTSQNKALSQRLSLFAKFFFHVPYIWVEEHVVLLARAPKLWALNFGSLLTCCILYRNIKTEM